MNRQLGKLLEIAAEKRVGLSSSPLLSVVIDSHRGRWLGDLHDLMAKSAAQATIEMRPSRFGGMEVRVTANRSSWDGMIMTHRGRP